MKTWKFFALILSCVMTLSSCSKENDPLLPEDKPKPEQPDKPQEPEQPEEPKVPITIDLTKNVVYKYGDEQSTRYEVEYIPVDNNNAFLRIKSNVAGILPYFGTVSNYEVKIPVKIVYKEKDGFPYLVCDGYKDDRLKTTLYSCSNLYSYKQEEVHLNPVIFGVQDCKFDINSAPESGINANSSVSGKGACV